MAEKKAKRIISAGGPRNQVVTRSHPLGYNRYKLKTTLNLPGVTCLRLEIRSQ